MSDENVEVIRRMLATFIEVDEGLVEPGQLQQFFAVDAALDMDPEVDPEGTRFHSIDEFIEWRTQWIEMFDDWSYTPEAFLEAGANRVAVTFRQRGRLRGTDDWLDMHYGIVYTVEKGSITASRMYVTVKDTLEAVGLSE
jgi:ketosteroid isomerase-like protein